MNKDQNKNPGKKGIIENGQYNHSSNGTAKTDNKAETGNGAASSPVRSRDEDKRDDRDEDESERERVWREGVKERQRQWEEEVKERDRVWREGVRQRQDEWESEVKAREEKYRQERSSGKSPGDETSD